MWFAGCIDNVVERRTEELGNTLGMLRSASLSDGDKSKSEDVPRGGWKVSYLSYSLKKSVFLALDFAPCCN